MFKLPYLVAFCLLVALAMPIYELILLSPFSHWTMTMLYFPIGMMFLIATLGGLIGVIVSLFAFFKKSTRPLAFKQLVFSIAILCAGFCGGVSGRMIRHDGFLALAERSKPLISAIKAYEAKHGAPPKSLQNLVPEYLSKVPGTGIGAYPEYRYSAHDLGVSEPKPSKGSWNLLVYCPPFPVFQWDEFQYSPGGVYPGIGGYIERIGDWGYLHE